LSQIRRGQELFWIAIPPLTSFASLSHFPAALKRGENEQHFEKFFFGRFPEDFLGFHQPNAAGTSGTRLPGMVVSLE
jgi:hypothetical protein